jgi:hypothetical protein
MPIDEAVRQDILSMSRTAHALTEAAYQQDGAVRGDAGWAEKQRILLADMALHLVQTSLKEGELSQEGLKKNLFSILTIADQFIDSHDLKKQAGELYAS